MIVNFEAIPWCLGRRAFLFSERRLALVVIILGELGTQQTFWAVGGLCRADDNNKGFGEMRTITRDSKRSGQNFNVALAGSREAPSMEGPRN